MSDTNGPDSEPASTPRGRPWQSLRALTRRAARPLEQFLKIEAASGIVLLLVTAVALVWANSPWADSYSTLWYTPLGIRNGSFVLQRPLEWFVNDGLMVIFFFVVGLEIRREIHHGELAEWRRAALPAIAALGGMIVPALLYLMLAGEPATRSGWGVPMATDIAFAVGVLTLLGRRVPPALRVLLLALAVIDDLGAILVIALFYSSGVAPFGLGLAVLGMLALVTMQRFGVQRKLGYVVPAFVIWWGVYSAGIHPTIAGVMVGLATPVASAAGGAPASSPAEGLIRALHPWVAFGIMPVFALANAGVSLQGVSLAGDAASVALGVGVGLVVGKPIGVLLACGIALKLRVASLPRGLGQRELLVLGVVAGIGFTMALFVAQLAFVNAELLMAAKLGVLLASASAAVLGLLLGRIVLVSVPVAGAAQSVDEAESSTEL